MFCRKLHRFAIVAVAAQAIFSASRVHPQAPSAPPVKKVLLIGIDGCRFDALQAADAPHLDALIAKGAVARPIRIFPERYRDANTVSGPGWSSILTGVWADKHGVLDNEFTTPHYDKFPHFFARLKEVQPQAVTASLANWAPIQSKITSAADVNPSFPIDEQLESPRQYEAADADVARAAVKLLAGEDPTATFVYFGQVDETGHATGFHPAEPQYIAAIERVDAHVGQLLDTIDNRSAHEREDWLVVVTSDHGGQGLRHGGGHNDPDIACSFLIVSGAAAEHGDIDEPCGLVDVAPTILAHLGAAIDPAWQLDGRPVGLRAAANR